MMSEKSDRERIEELERQIQGLKMLLQTLSVWMAGVNELHSVDSKIFESFNKRLETLENKNEELEKWK